jgi:hypothetical protein
MYTVSTQNTITAQKNIIAYESDLSPLSRTVATWSTLPMNDKINTVSKQYDKIMTRNVALSNVWNVNKRHHILLEPLPTNDLTFK